MIDIADKHNCCGCSACVQACPKQCISFDEDENGFRYPLVNKDACIDCGLCEKVCPCLNQNEPRKPLKVYAAINPNEEIRIKSSSGGIFTMLAESIIDVGGVVFGARFDENWEVMHDYTETKLGLEAFRGSKYVQSRIGETYKQARDFLKTGRKVLFSGTSCQIAGLKKFLRKDYDNLLTVDVVCHGVPSPLVWREYLKELTERPQGVTGKNTVLSFLKDKPVITGISFRDKSTGWKKYGFVVRGKFASKADQNSVMSSYDDIILHEAIGKNMYMKIFLSNLCLRPSCNNCPAKAGRCLSDITLADYWGYWLFHKEVDDDRGMSAVLINSAKGAHIFTTIKCNFILSKFPFFHEGNRSYSESTEENKSITMFWTSFLDTRFQNVNQLLNSNPSYFQKLSSLYLRFYHKIKRVILKVSNN